MDKPVSLRNIILETFFFLFSWKIFSTYKVKAARYDVNFHRVTAIPYFAAIITKSFGMETLKQLFKYSCTMLFCGIILLACSSDEPEADPGPQPETPVPSTVEGLDELSDQLQFHGSTKKQGTIPAALTNVPNLKISFKDTLYLVEEVSIPIKFHHDASTNVAGVYVQVHGANANNALYASYYIDVPELAETGETDTLSVVLVSFSITDLDLPVSVPVTIIPYDKNAQPLGKTEKVFTVEELIDDLPTSGRVASGACDFTSPPVQGWWQWAYTMQKEEDEIVFLSSPDVVYGGQNIKGCCANGVSDYGASCLNGDPKNEKTLFFPTFYQIAGETFIFNASGTFERITLEIHRDPDTENTNFCGVAYGAVTNTFEFVTFEGNWTLDPASKYLQLQTTKSSVQGGGYGNAGGILRYNCHSLILSRGPSEGIGPKTELFYFRQNPEDYDWYPLP